MRKLLVAVLFAASISVFGLANAADGCGPGCHSTPSGACIVDGWGTPGVRNECPAGARSRPPCGPGYAFKFGTCFQK
jgi:hypothetical protein